MLVVLFGRHVRVDFDESVSRRLSAVLAVDGRLETTDGACDSKRLRAVRTREGLSRSSTVEGR